MKYPYCITWIRRIWLTPYGSECRVDGLGMDIVEFQGFLTAGYEFLKCDILLETSKSPVIMLV